MKKKVFCSMAVVVLLLGCIAFFKPRSFHDVVGEDSQIKMVLTQLGLRNGESYMDSIDYQDITTEQQREILSLLENYNYRKTFKTVFSDGSVSGIGNQLLDIYVYHDNSLSGSIRISSSGKVIVNDKNYDMKNAEQFIEQITKIAE